MLKCPNYEEFFFFLKVAFVTMANRHILKCKPGPEVINHFSCSAQLRLKFILLINVKMPTIVGNLTFISKINYMFWQSLHEISTNFGHFSNCEQFEFHAQHRKKFCNLGTGL